MFDFAVEDHIVVDDNVRLQICFLQLQRSNAQERRFVRHVPASQRRQFGGRTTDLIAAETLVLQSLGCLIAIRIFECGRLKQIKVLLRMFYD